MGLVKLGRERNKDGILTENLKQMAKYVPGLIIHPLCFEEKDSKREFHKIREFELYPNGSPPSPKESFK